MGPKYTQDQLHALALAVAELHTLSSGEVVTPHCGICTNLDSALRIDGVDADERVFISNVMHTTFPKWPQFSGEPYYPIPGGEDLYDNADLLWEGEYGDQRKDLAKFCAEQFAQIIKESTEAVEKEEL